MIMAGIEKITKEKEEKDLIIKDLCARLPYSGLQIHISYEDGFKYDKTLTYEDVKNYSQLPACSTTIVKPYLRSLSSMTEEEYQDFNNIRTEHALKCLELSDKESFEFGMRLQQEEMSYLYQRHYDVCGLIPKGLALEAPEGMYNK